MTTEIIRFTHENVEDSNWEPDGVTFQVRFCEGDGTYQFNEIHAATLH